MCRKAARSNSRGGALAVSRCASRVSIDLSLKTDTWKLRERANEFARLAHELTISQCDHVKSESIAKLIARGPLLRRSRRKIKRKESGGQKRLTSLNLTQIRHRLRHDGRLDDVMRHLVRNNDVVDV